MGTRICGCSGRSTGDGVNLRLASGGACRVGLSSEPAGCEANARQN